MKTRTTKSVRAPIAAVAMIALSGLLQSCATPQQRVTTTGEKARKTESIVCPQCKMVAVASFPPWQAHPWAFSSPSAGWYPGWSSFGWGGLAYPQKTYEDKCPGCQGALTTFAREGKLKHKCSICAQRPFKCPVFHPETS